MTQYFMGGGFGTSIPSVGGSINAGRAFFQVPNLAISINDGGAVNANVLGCTITYGFDIGIATATVDFTAANLYTGGTVRPDPTNSLDGLDYFNNVKIYCGDANNPLNSNALRFSGVYLRTEATMWPSVFRIICKGNLYKAAQYYQASMFTGVPASFFPDMPIGVPLVDLDPKNGHPIIPGYCPGELGVNTTDQEVVRAILSKVAEASGLNFDHNDIQGTGHQIYYSMFSAFWPPYRSAWEQIQLFDAAFLGYRTYESVAGRIVRSKIFGYPSGPSKFDFTEGIDIFEAQTTRSVEQLINSSYVEGMSSIAGKNIGDLQIVFAYVPGSNKYQGSQVVEQFSSPFIESSMGLDPGGELNVLNADDVAAWRLAERNRELVNVQFTTFRDMVIDAGITVTVNSPHAAIAQPIWVQRVEVQVQANPPLFQQTITGLSGGDPGLGGPGMTSTGGPVT